MNHQMAAGRSALDPALLPLVPGLSRRRSLAFGRAMRRGTLEALVDLFDRLGSPARISLPGTDMVLISRADDAHDVLFHKQDRYVKGEEYDIPGLGLRSGLVTSRGEEWRRDRAMLNPLFAKRHLRTLTGTMAGCVDDMLERWDRELANGARVDVAHKMMLATLDIAARTMFGRGLDAQDTEAMGDGISEVLELIVEVGNSPMTFALNALPGVSMKRAARAHVRRVRRIDRRLARADAIIGALIRAREADPAAPDGDFLALMLAGRDADDGTAMSHQKVLEQSLTFLGAGHETTATGLAWTWHLLAANPQARERMLAEIDAVLGGRPATFDDVDRLPWTRACFSEALRIHPPVYLSMRRALRDDALGGYRVRAGSIVVLATHVLHRDPEHWPDPRRFDPARFLPGAGKDRPRAAYLPFGSGRRVCIGSQFAMIEATLVLAGVSQRYLLDPAPGWVVEEEGFTTLRPKGGLPMILRRRTTGGSR